MSVKQYTCGRSHCAGGKKRPSSAPIITVNWKADSGERWTVPLGGGAGRLFKVGKQPLNVQLLAYGNVERRRYGPDWSLRFQVQFLFPN